METIEYKLSEEEKVCATCGSPLTEMKKEMRKELVIYSIIQTAIANNLKPMYYLEYVFEQLQLKTDLQISDILPWSASIPEKCKNPDTP